MLKTGSFWMLLRVFSASERDPERPFRPVSTGPDAPALGHRQFQPDQMEVG